MSHFDSCQLTLIWLAHITLNYWQPCPGKVYFHKYFGKCVILHHLYVGQNDWFLIYACKIVMWHLSADVWFGQLSIHPHMDGLHNWQTKVNIWARSNVTLDVCLHVVSVRTIVRTLRRNQISSSIACSRLSDSGEDAKEKGARNVGGAGRRKKEGR